MDGPDAGAQVFDTVRDRGQGHDTGVDVQVAERDAELVRLVDDPLRDLDLLLRVERDAVLVAGEADDVPVRSGDEREEGLALRAFLVDRVDAAGSLRGAFLQKTFQEQRVRAVEAERSVGLFFHDANEPFHGIVLEGRLGGRCAVQEVGLRRQLDLDALADERFITVRDRLFDGGDRTIYLFANNNHNRVSFHTISRVC